MTIDYRSRHSCVNSKFDCQEESMDQRSFRQCIDACNACAIACDHCVASCLQEPDVNMMARCIALDTDCAQLCRLAASFMARQSELSDLLCETCAEICEACGDECERYNMAHCRNCAEACRACADECRNISGD
jgi:hypothetical protein